MVQTETVSPTCEDLAEELRQLREQVRALRQALEDAWRTLEQH